MAPTPDISRPAGYYREPVSPYKVGFWITAVLAFFVAWIFAIASWGFLLGVGLGWIPAIFIALIVGAAWPLIAGALGLVVVIGFVVWLRDVNASSRQTQQAAAHDSPVTAPAPSR